MPYNLPKVTALQAPLVQFRPHWREQAQRTAHQNHVFVVVLLRQQPQEVQQAAVDEFTQNVDVVIGGALHVLEVFKHAQRPQVQVAGETEGAIVEGNQFHGPATNIHQHGAILAKLVKMREALHHGAGAVVGFFWHGQLVHPHPRAVEQLVANEVGVVRFEERLAAVSSIVSHAIISENLLNRKQCILERGSE